MFKKLTAFILSFVIIFASCSLEAFGAVADEISILPERHLVVNDDLTKTGTDGSGNSYLQLWVNLRDSKGETVKDLNFTDNDVVTLENAILLNGVPLSKGTANYDSTSLITFGGSDGVQFYVKILFKNNNGTEYFNPFGIKQGVGYINFEVKSGIEISNKYYIPAVKSYYLLEKGEWMNPEATNTTSITQITARISNSSLDGSENDNKYLIVNAKTDKSVIENNGLGDFQVNSSETAKLFCEKIVFNGLTLKECFDTFNDTNEVKVQCSENGVIFWAKLDYKTSDGRYSDTENYFGIDYTSDFTFEVKDGLVLNGTAVNSGKWYFNGNTKGFTAVTDSFEIPQSVNVIDYNSRYGDGIMERAKNDATVIRLKLDQAIPDYLFEAQGIIDLESEGYDISALVRKYFYFDGLNLETWSGYRNSTLNTVKMYLAGSHIEIRNFTSFIPTAKTNEVHWLEIKDGFTTVKGVRVNPIKLYYDPQKGYWEKVESFIGLKRPNIIIERSKSDYIKPENTGHIDNSYLMPEYKPNSQVMLEDNGNGLLSPDWIKTLMIEQVNVLYASENGMLSGMDKTLDHLEEMGINGICLNPISAPSQYLNYGPHTVSPALSGTDDYEEGWRIVAEFVEKAHQRNIRVFFDVVTWGVSQAAPIVKEHRDWFTGIDPKYNGYNYDWENQDVVDWFSEQLVDMIVRTNADGFRADTGVNYCGYDVYRNTRNELYKKGYYICMFTEGATERLDVFDFEQNSTVDAHFRDFAGSLFTETYNIVDSVKNGTGFGTAEQAANKTAGLDRYYVSTISHHDGYDYDVNGDIIKIGYSGILSPFIPFWYIGDEWNNAHVSVDGNRWLFGNEINWDLLETNREFYEQVKKLIAIRRLYPEIFDYYPQNHRDSNICPVQTNLNDSVSAYARYYDNNAVIIVPNTTSSTSNCEITTPISDMNLSDNNIYVVTDLITGEKLIDGTVADILTFKSEIKPGELGVFSVETIGIADKTKKASFSPNNELTKVVVDSNGNTALQIWINCRNTSDGKTINDITLNSNDIEVIKKIVKINGIRLSDALSNSNYVSFNKFDGSNGLQFYVKVIVKNKGGSICDNPFKITEDFETVNIVFDDQLVFSEKYSFYPVAYTYSKSDSNWSLSENTVYIVPHDTQTQIVGDGRVNLWFKFRDDKLLGNGMSNIDLTDETAIKHIKKSLYINGVQLAEAISQNSNIKFVTFASGEFYIQVRYADSNGNAVNNPFNITKSPITIKVEMQNDIILSDYIAERFCKYFDFASNTWSDLPHLCDVNSDGFIDNRDLISLKKHIAGINQNGVRDLNNDGTVNAGDLSYLKNYLNEI